MPILLIALRNGRGNTVIHAVTCKMYAIFKDNPYIVYEVGEFEYY